MKTKIVFFLIIMRSLSLTAGSFYVSPNALLSGDGGFNNPWTFQTALNHPSALMPGDTVWLKGGVYTNIYDSQTSFNCFTKGTIDKPIIFRNYNNERATLDGQQLYSLYVALGNSHYTWFWGIEVTNSFSTDRDHDIPGGITCTAENIKFINMIVHDTGSGIDTWKTAKNTETYGCIIYHIGNNLNNNGNLEGHGHGMYLQNDTIGTKSIHNNIIFSTYGYGMKVWQTTTTSALGNFDIQNNIIFNGGAASENLGGVGNNYRTHNFFVVSNSVGNPVKNTIIKHNYTFSGTNTPRPPVNAFGLNYGVSNMILDSNYLTCQTRLGFNNTPLFDASVKGNKIIGGIPPVYGVYLWGFLQTDYPNNIYIPDLPTSGSEYFVMPNKYESGLANVVIYNWSGDDLVQIDVSGVGLKAGDKYELINVMDYFQEITEGIFEVNGNIKVPMTGHSFTQAVGSKKDPVSQFPYFGVFVIRKKGEDNSTKLVENQIENEITIFPNPSNGIFTLNCSGFSSEIEIFNNVGEKILTFRPKVGENQFLIDLTAFSKGTYLIQAKRDNHSEIYKVVTF